MFVKGPLFSYLRLVYDSKLNGKMNDYTMTIDYTFTLDSAENKRSCVLTMNTDCMAGSCNIYKMLVLVIVKKPFIFFIKCIVVAKQ